MGASFPFKETAREVLDPAGVADDAKAHMTSSEQLIASFATRCAWPHLEHERLLSHPSIGAKAVSANKCPRAFKSSPVGRPFAIVLQKPPSFHSLFKPSWPFQIGGRKSGKAHGQTGLDGLGIRNYCYSGCSGASNTSCLFMLYSSSI